MLINISNHPSAKWAEEQLAEAQKRFGEVVDLGFPEVGSSTIQGAAQILRLLAPYLEPQGLTVRLQVGVTLHVTGEPVTCGIVYAVLSTHGVDGPYARAVSHREVQELPDGRKVVTFRFQGWDVFRNPPTLMPIDQIDRYESEARSLEMRAYDLDLADKVEAALKEAGGLFEGEVSGSRDETWDLRAFVRKARELGHIVLEQSWSRGGGQGEVKILAKWHAEKYLGGRLVGNKLTPASGETRGYWVGKGGETIKALERALGRRLEVV